MISLKQRSQQKEHLDADNIPFADIRLNMRELNIVNSRLGGHNITINAINEILKRCFSHLPDGVKQAGKTQTNTEKTERNLVICEIGCGGGDNLAAVSKWCIANKIKADIIGIDIKPECIAFAREQYPHLNATWISSDYRKVSLQQKPTIIFSSLFCHHFPDDEIVNMLGWMHKNCMAAFFINDLHRHPIAYHLIKWLTRIFSRSYLVKHDAPLSVARAFKKEEWIALFKRAGLDHISIRWKWAFRYLIICHK